MASFQGAIRRRGEEISPRGVVSAVFNSRVVGVLRYVTSLREAQHRVLVESLLASAAALGVECYFYQQRRPARCNREGDAAAHFGRQLRHHD